MRLVERVVLTGAVLLLASMGIGVRMADGQTQTVVVQPQDVPNMVESSLWVLATSGESNNVSFTTLIPTCTSGGSTIPLGCLDSSDTECTEMSGYQLNNLGACGQQKSPTTCYCDSSCDDIDQSGFWECSSDGVLDDAIDLDGATITSIAAVPNGDTSIIYLGTSDGKIYPTVLEPASGSDAPQLSTPEGWPTSYSFECEYDGTYEDCGQVVALAVDPTHNFLYASFSTATEQCSDNDGAVTCNQFTVSMDDSHYLARASLLTIDINSAGQLDAETASQLPHAVWGNAAGWGTRDGAEYTPVTVGPNLRTYPPCGDTFRPGTCPLQGALSKYAETGVVFYSGIVGGIDKYDNQQVPHNVGYLCYGGYEGCELAYDFPLYDSNSFSVITAAEYGMWFPDGATTPEPVLFWNQVRGDWLDYGVNTGVNTILTSIFKDYNVNDPNLVVACPVSTFASSPYATNPCDDQQYWVQPTGNGDYGFGQGSGTPAFASQIIYTPPTQGGPSEDGVLTVAVGGPGYTTNQTFYNSKIANSGSFYSQTSLLYTSVSSEANLSSAGTPTNPFLTQHCAGSTALYADQNGNILVNFGESGLVGYNALESAMADQDYSSMLLSPDKASCAQLTTAQTAGSKAMGAIGLISDTITIFGAMAAPAPSRFQGKAKATGDLEREGSLKIGISIPTGEALQGVDLTRYDRLRISDMLSEVDAEGAPIPLFRSDADWTEQGLPIRRGAKSDSARFEMSGRDPTGAKAEVKIRNGVMKIQAKISRIALGAPAACLTGASTADLHTRLVLEGEGVESLVIGTDQNWTCKPRRCSTGEDACFDLRANYRQTDSDSGSDSDSSQPRAPDAKLDVKDLTRSESEPNWVKFDASRSSDRDGTIVSYDFALYEKVGRDFVPLASPEPSSESVAYAHLHSGEYEVMLTVTDDSGLTSTQTRRFSVRGETKVSPPYSVGVDWAFGPQWQPGDPYTTVPAAEPVGGSFTASCGAGMASMGGMGAVYSLSPGSSTWTMAGSVPANVMMDWAGKVVFGMPSWNYMKKTQDQEGGVMLWNGNTMTLVFDPDHGATMTDASNGGDWRTTMTCLHDSGWRSSITTIAPYGTGFVVGLRNGSVQHYTGSSWRQLQDDGWGQQVSTMIPYRDGFVLGLGGVLQPYRFNDDNIGPGAVMYFDGSFHQLQGTGWNSGVNAMVPFGDGFVVGLHNGSVQHYDGSQWHTIVGTGTGEPVTTMMEWETGVVIGYRDGSVRYWNGDTNTYKLLHDSGWAQAITSILPYGTGFVVGLGGWGGWTCTFAEREQLSCNGGVEYYDGTKWTELHGTGWLQGVTAMAPWGDGFVVGLTNAAIEHYDGATWKELHACTGWPNPSDTCQPGAIGVNTMMVDESGNLLVSVIQGG